MHANKTKAKKCNINLLSNAMAKNRCYKYSNIKIDKKKKKMEKSFNSISNCEK